MWRRSRLFYGKKPDGHRKTVQWRPTYSLTGWPRDFGTWLNEFLGLPNLVTSWLNTQWQIHWLSDLWRTEFCHNSANRLGKWNTLCQHPIPNATRVITAAVVMFLIPELITIGEVQFLSLLCRATDFGCTRKFVLPGVLVSLYNYESGRVIRVTSMQRK